MNCPKCKMEMVAVTGADGWFCVLCSIVHATVTVDNNQAKREAEMKCPDREIEEYYKDWEDDIPWDCLVDEIKWVARDRSGWWGYEFRPQPDLQNRMWYESEDLYSLKAVKMPKGPDDWEIAIARRPE